MLLLPDMCWGLATSHYIPHLAVMHHTHMFAPMTKQHGPVSAHRHGTCPLRL